MSSWRTQAVLHRPRPLGRQLFKRQRHPHRGPGRRVRRHPPRLRLSQSENADFADACEAAGITFIGPSGDVIRAMGNKAAARKLMQSAGVPVVPGSDGAVDTAEQAKALADSIGYPVLIKASAGGGGRGMRRVYEPEELHPPV